MRRRTTPLALAAVVAAIAILASGCVLNGTWSPYPGFDPDPARTTAVTGLSCTDATFCLATGQESGVPGGQPSTAFVQRWDGTAWSAVDAPPKPAGATRISLFEPSCATSTSCAIVTGTTTGSFLEWAFARWDGTGWSSVPLTANPNGDQNQVACASDGSCLFVAAGVGSTTWDGASYTTTSYAAPELSTLSCAAIDACVGIFGQSAYVWDGATWTSMIPALPGAPTWRWLWSIDCASATDCLAVGSARDSANTTYPVGSHWDGTTWTATPIPAAGRELRAVSCSSRVACVATGYTDQDAVTPSAFGWNGADWYEIDAPPAPRSFGNVWDILSCTTGDQCLAIESNFLSPPSFERYAWTS